MIFMTLTLAYIKFYCYYRIWKNIYYINYIESYLYITYKRIDGFAGLTGRMCRMREFRCDSEAMRKGYLALAAQVSKAIEKGTLSVYDTLQLVVIDDVVVNWYGKDPFHGRYYEKPEDVLLQMVGQARYEFEKPYFEAHSTSTLAELAIKKPTQKQAVPVVDQVFTDSEAAKLWEVGLTAVIKACQGTGLNCFNETECRESDGTFLISEAGMTRLFGERLDDQGMSIVFMHIGSEEAMLVRSKLRKIYEAKAGAKAEVALHERMGEIVTSCVKSIANGHTVELLHTIEEVAKEVGIESKVARVVTDFRRYNRIVWAYLFTLVDSDELEVWRNIGENTDTSALLNALQEVKDGVANGSAKKDGKVSTKAKKEKTVTTQAMASQSRHNPLLAGYDDEILDEHGLKAERREWDQANNEYGHVNEEALTDDISYEDLMANVIETDLTDLISKEKK